MSILIDAGTTFVVQGITAPEAVDLTRGCLDYGDGAKLVGGVAAGHAGHEVHGVRVFDTVEQAVADHGRPVDGCVVTVAPEVARDAVFEALDHGIRLVVVVTDQIPRRDVAQMVELAGLRGARIIGPGSLGILVPDRVKVGPIGGPAEDAARSFAKGRVGVIARSGAATTELSVALRAADIGLSTAVCVGGGAIIGQSYAELMPLFEADETTEAIVISSEPGGRTEAELARWTSENESRLPVVALRTGTSADSTPDSSFGHAGAIVEGTAAAKGVRLREAGIRVTAEVSELPDLVRAALRDGAQPSATAR